MAAVLPPSGSISGRSGPAPRDPATCQETTGNTPESWRPPDGFCENTRHQSGGRGDRKVGGSETETQTAGL
ncbi:hypothetical protein EYF80_061369 [Liparis tanakae]|uniref:Uncharacterized protein n=1 Tax=Liparis tanakae TaxID=230148 RepID=A0A4Z2EI36_9TELE|nr:hypothetical protein EYF80_061369 [Liparis tanakae]